MKDNTPPSLEKTSWEMRTGSTRFAAFYFLLSMALMPYGALLSEPSGGGARPPRPLVDTALDVNGDEILDQGEIANAAAVIAKLDANKDEKLTREELHPKRQDGNSGREAQKPARTPVPARPDQTGMPRKPRPPIVAALDVNSDGIIDTGEVAAAPAALKKLDKDGDGSLSPDEYRPPRPTDNPGPQPERTAQAKPR